MDKLTVKSIIVFVAFVAFSNKTTAQNLYIKDVQGVPIVVSKADDIKGSPYLNDNWVNASVKLNNGITYKENMYVKYNQEKDELYFKGNNDETLSFVDAVKEFTIQNNELKYYKNGYKDIPGTSKNTFFEVLANGTLQLLKKTKVYIMENKDYGSAVTTKSYTKDIKYYIVSGDNAQQIKNDKKSLLNVLDDKKDQIEEYIKSNKSNLKSDVDLAKIVNYYNTL
ncbi:MAG: hypothetical protein EOP45_02050 [Sphingobacteriaceae bacterium]|nr:MAG: hypothetical protein EOP45_02050 [Sphingobacteriaceae bacterium]